MQRLEGLDIPTFPLINLWDGEDDQIPALQQTAKDLEFREPIIGNCIAMAAMRSPRSLTRSLTRW